MGNITSLRNPLLPPFAASHGHWISDLRFVKRCIRRFERHQVDFGWAVNFDAFRAIFQPPRTERGGSAYHISEAEYKQVWSIWDPGSHGRTDVLQIFAGTILASKGAYDEKVSMLFDLFDLNLDRSINREEMTILVRAALSGWCRMIGAAVPDSDELTQIARLAFKSADRQERTDARITLRELLLWSHITAECVDILGRFGTTDIEAIRSNQGSAGVATSVGGASAASSIAGSSALSSASSGSAAALSTDDAASPSESDARASGSGSKHASSSSSSLASALGTQNLHAQVDEAAVREREILRLKPSIPTIQELTVREEGKKAAARKRAEMRILSSPRHVNAVSNQPREHANAGSAAAASVAAMAGSSSVAASASSSAPASARSSGSGDGTAPLPRWHKRIGDMVFLRQNFAACEIPGSGVPIDSADSQASSSSTLKMPSINRRKSDLTSLTAAAASANHRPTLPCSGYAALVVFGARMKSHGGRWKRLPAFLTQAGPIQAGEGLSFRDVLRSYFTEYAITKRELDAMVKASEEREQEALCPPKVALAASIEPIPGITIGAEQPVSPTQPQQPMHAHSQSQPFFASPTSAGVMLSPLSGSLSAGSPSSASSAAAATSPSVAPAVPRALILKIAQVFDSEDNHADRGESSGRVSLAALMAILGPSRKLAELVDLERVQAQLNQPIAAAAASAAGNGQGQGHGRAPSLPALSSAAASAPSASAAAPTHASRLVSLPDLLEFLFRFSHSAAQITEMQSWVLPLPLPLSSGRRAELRRVWARADRERVGSIGAEELGAALQEAQQSLGAPPFNAEQMQYLLAPFALQPQQSQAQSGSNGSSSSSNGSGAPVTASPASASSKRRVDWVTFVRIVRSVLGDTQHITSAAASPPHPQHLPHHPPPHPPQHLPHHHPHPHAPTSPPQQSTQQSSSGSLRSRASM